MKAKGEEQTKEIDRQLKRAVKKYFGHDIPEEPKLTPEQQEIQGKVQAKYDALKGMTTEELYARGENLLFKVYHAKREVNMIRNILINRGDIKSHGDLTEYADSIPEHVQQIPFQDFNTGTLLIIHGDSCMPREIHTVVLLDQTLSEAEADKKFEEMKEEIRDWIGDYDQQTLTKILVGHGLSGTVLDVTGDDTRPKGIRYTECFY